MAKSDGENNGKTAPVTAPVNPETAFGPLTAEAGGCVISFLTEKNNEIGAVCGGVQRNPQEEYVQKDEEKELGGEA
jgi:hypothetical protein